MLIAYLAAWIAAVGCAAAGCALPTLLLGVVLIVIIFRWEVARLIRLFGPHLPLARRNG